MAINRLHRIRSIERFHFLVLPPGEVARVALFGTVELASWH